MRAGAYILKITSTIENGFSGDTSAQENLILVQGVMRHRKHQRKPFCGSSLDPLKACVSVSHDALFPAIITEGAPDLYVYAI